MQFRTLGWVVLGVAVVVAMKSTSGPVATGDAENKKNSEVTNSSNGSAWSPNGRVISLGIFNSIQPGLLSYAQLANLVGPGELASETNTDGIVTKGYRWINPDGSFMILIFQNGRLVSKNQSGLRTL